MRRNNLYMLIYTRREGRTTNAISAIGALIQLIYRWYYFSSVLMAKPPTHTQPPLVYSHTINLFLPYLLQTNQFLKLTNDPEPYECYKIEI